MLQLLGRKEDFLLVSLLIVTNALCRSNLAVLMIIQEKLLLQVVKCDEMQLNREALCV